MMGQTLCEVVGFVDTESARQLSLPLAVRALPS